MITLSIRYTIDARKRADFEQYARALGTIIPRCGGGLVGYWLPTKFAGPTNQALALIDFPSLTAYEQYRERLAKDDDNLDSIRLRGKRLHPRRGPRVPRARLAVCHSPAIAGMTLLPISSMDRMVVGWSMRDSWASRSRWPMPSSFCTRAKRSATSSGVPATM
jgi:NIPSNAP protein